MECNPNTVTQGLFTHTQKPSQIYPQHKCGSIGYISTMLWMRETWNTGSLSFLNYFTTFGQIEPSLVVALFEPNHLWLNHSKRIMFVSHSLVWLSIYRTSLSRLIRNQSCLSVRWNELQYSFGSTEVHSRSNRGYFETRLQFHLRAFSPFKNLGFTTQTSFNSFPYIITPT